MNILVGSSICDIHNVNYQQLEYFLQTNEIYKYSNLIYGVDTKAIKIDKILEYQLRKDLNQSNKISLYDLYYHKKEPNSTSCLELSKMLLSSDMESINLAISILYKVNFPINIDFMTISIIIYELYNSIRSVSHNGDKANAMYVGKDIQFDTDQYNKLSMIIIMNNCPHLANRLYKLILSNYKEIREPDDRHDTPFNYLICQFEEGNKLFNN